MASSVVSQPIGIDLGTTYSCVGVFTNGSVNIIANDQGNRTTPSVVAFTEVERLVGDPAKGQMGINPENTVYGMCSGNFDLDRCWKGQRICKKACRRTCDL